MNVSSVTTTGVRTTENSFVCPHLNYFILFLYPGALRKGGTAGFVAVNLLVFASQWLSCPSVTAVSQNSGHSLNAAKQFRSSTHSPSICKGVEFEGSHSAPAIHHLPSLHTLFYSDLTE